MLQLALGRWAIGKRKQRVIGWAAACCAPATLAVSAAPACLFGGLGMYMLHGMSQTHASRMCPGLRGTAVSLFAVCLFGGPAAGKSVGALLVDVWLQCWLFAAAMDVLPLPGIFFSVCQRRYAPAQGPVRPG